ncbi:MAG: hypothetical protein ABII00_11150 [Elusimicrobiota bacterium]
MGESEAGSAWAIVRAALAPFAAEAAGRERATGTGRAVLEGRFELREAESEGPETLWADLSGATDDTTGDTPGPEEAPAPLSTAPAKARAASGPGEARASEAHNAELMALNIDDALFGVLSINNLRPYKDIRRLSGAVGS